MKSIANHIPQLTLFATLLVIHVSPAEAQELLWRATGNTPYEQGSMVTAMPDLDGDGWQDFAAGNGNHDSRGIVHLYSGHTRTRIQTFYGLLRGEGLWKAQGLGDLDGDGVSEFLLGAPPAGYFNMGAGRAYLYSGATFQVLHTWDGEQRSNALGAALAGTGDLDGDGVDDFLLGAPKYTWFSPVDSLGKIYAYSGRTLQLLYTIVGEAEYDGMQPLAHLGDVDGDGRSDFLASAAGHDAAARDAGRIYVISGRKGRILYYRDGAGISTTLGSSGAAAGDLDQDGVTDFVVGAKGQGGAAYLYSGATGTLLRSWTAPPGYTTFGWDLDAGQDANGDGVPDVAIGTANQASTEPPSVFLYSGRSGRLLHRFQGTSDRGYGDAFGYAVALLPDVTGDGLAELLVGAPATVSHGINTGASYLFAGNDLYLDAEYKPRRQRLVLDVRGGPPGAPAVLLVQDLHQGGWSQVRTGALDKQGDWTIKAEVPPALVGRTLRFQALVRSNRATGPQWLDTLVTPVRLQ